MIILSAKIVNLLILLIPILLPRSHSMKGLEKQPFQQSERDRINRLFFQVTASMQQLKEYQDKSKQNQGSKLLYSYLSILESTAQELHRARAKYTSIDKEKLIDEKMEWLATNLKNSKSQAIIMNEKMGKINNQIKQVKERNDLLEWNVQMLKKQLREKEDDRKFAKEYYRSNLNSTMLTNIPLVQKIQIYKGANQSQRQSFNGGERQEIREIKTCPVSTRTKATKPRQRGESFHQVFGFK